MKKYQVQITETLQRIVEVEAESFDDAINKVNDQYENMEIVLDANDHIQTIIECVD